MGKRRHNAKGRSAGESRFVQLPYWVLETPAVLALSGTAFKVLMFMLKRYNGQNNGKIGFGARSGSFIKIPATGEIKDVPIGIRPRTVTDALKELEAAGLIACTKASTFHQKRTTKEWRLTWLPVGHQPATKEFVHYVPGAKRPPKQKPGRQAALLDKIQSGSPLYGPLTKDQDTLYRAAHRPMRNADRAASRSHLVSIPSAADALSKARALSERRALAASAARSSALKFPSKLATKAVTDD